MEESEKEVWRWELGTGVGVMLLEDGAGTQGMWATPGKVEKARTHLLLWSLQKEDSPADTLILIP